MENGEAMLGRKQRLISVVLVSILLMPITLSACDYDPYEGRRPTDYPNTIWVCENADMYFVVGESVGIFFEGKLKTDEGIVDFRFLFSAFDSWAKVYNAEHYTSASEYTREDFMFSGECKFRKNKFEITVEDKNEYFKELPITLVFHRQDWTGSEGNTILKSWD